MQIEEDLVYRPKTRETKDVYETMLNFVAKKMGDYPLQTIKGALDEIIAILKSEGGGQTDSERKAEVESLMDKVTE